MGYRVLIASVATGILVWSLATGPVSNAARQQTARSAAVQTPIPIDAPSARAMMDRYCVTCHNDRLKTGGLALTGVDVGDVAARGETWEKVVQKLRAGVMPPAGAARPDAATYEALTSWFESELDRAALFNPNPGRSPPFIVSIARSITTPSATCWQFSTSTSPRCCLPTTRVTDSTTSATRSGCRRRLEGVPGGGAKNQPGGDRRPGNQPRNGYSTASRPT
jgi:hypothetical protein